jgi:hypothetical protein
MLEGFGDVRMAAVGIGSVKKTKAVIVAVEEEFGEAFDTERSLVGMVADADRAGAHGQAAGLYAGFAEGDGIGSGELLGKSRDGEGPAEKCVRMKPGGSGGASGAMEEFASFHRASLLRRFQG